MSVLAVQTHFLLMDDNAEQPCFTHEKQRKKKYPIVIVYRPQHNLVIVACADVLDGVV